jgi:hypothetical protein
MGGVGLTQPFVNGEVEQNFVAEPQPGRRGSPAIGVVSMRAIACERLFADSGAHATYSNRIDPAAGLGF